MCNQILDYFNQKKTKEAVSYINTLQLHKEFNIEELITKLTHQDKFEDASSLAKASKDY